MTVPASSAISDVYVGDDEQTVFAFPFKIFKPEDILARVNNGEYVSELPSSAYTVNINSGDNPGGGIVLNEPLPEGHKLVITRNVEFSQTIPQSNGQAHYAEDFEKTADLLTFQTQYLSEKVNRCIELDPTIAPTITDLVTQVNDAASSASQSKDEATAAVDEITGQVATHNAASNPHSQYILATPGRLVPVGSIIISTHETIPNKFLRCDGSTISRTSYADLFAIIGTRFGIGDGSTTFNTPVVDDISITTGLLNTTLSANWDLSHTIGGDRADLYYQWGVSYTGIRRVISNDDSLGYSGWTGILVPRTFLFDRKIKYTCEFVGTVLDHYMRLTNSSRTVSVNLTAAITTSQTDQETSLITEEWLITNGLTTDDLYIELYGTANSGGADNQEIAITAISLLDDSDTVKSLLLDSTIYSTWSDVNEQLHTEGGSITQTGETPSFNVDGLATSTESAKHIIKYEE